MPVRRAVLYPNSQSEVTVKATNIHENKQTISFSNIALVTLLLIFTIKVGVEAH